MSAIVFGSPVALAIVGANRVFRDLDMLDKGKRLCEALNQKITLSLESDNKTAIPCADPVYALIAKSPNQLKLFED